MTGGFWGADAGELRALAKDFDQKASQLSTVAGTLTASINGTSAWQGPDASTFRQEWNTTYRASLSKAQLVLAAAATALIKNADEQEQTSAVDGGPGGSGPGGSGPGGSGPGGSGPGGSGGDGSGDPGSGDTPTIPGASDEQNDLLHDLLTNPALLAAEGIFDDIAVVDLLNTLTQLRLAGSFSTLEGALGFSRFAGGFNTLNEFLSGNNWGALTQGLSNALGDGAMAARVGSAAEFLGTAGKVLGPAGVVLGVATVGSDIAQGNYGRAAYDGVATTLGMAALVTPPPADLALGLAAGGMALGGVLYDNVPVFHDAVDATGEAIGDAAEAIGDGAHDLAEGASDFAEGVADKAKDVWPF